MRWSPARSPRDHDGKESAVLRSGEWADMKIRMPVLSAVAVCCIAFGAQPLAAEEQTMPSSAIITAVHVFHPSIPHGTPVSGNCWTTSIATNRPSAYRCMAGNSISDPCFATSNSSIVVCDANPAKNKRGFAMRVKGPLPAAPRPTGPITPWLVQLRDGTTCSPLTGTRPFANGVVVGYDCAPMHKPPAGTYVGLADQLRMYKPLWTGRRVLYRGDAHGTVIVSSNWVPIVAAWR